MNINLFLVISVLLFISFAGYYFGILAAQLYLNKRGVLIAANTKVYTVSFLSSCIGEISGLGFLLLSYYFVNAHRWNNGLDIIDKVSPLSALLLFVGIPLIITVLLTAKEIVKRTEQRVI